VRETRNTGRTWFSVTLKAPRSRPTKSAIADLACKIPKPSKAISNNLNHRLNLNRHVERKGTHPDGAACVPASIAEHFNEQIRAAVDYLWMVGKIRYGIDHAEHSAKTNDLVETADLVA